MASDAGGEVSCRDDVGPWEWTVTWGVLGRPGFTVEHVEAFDPDEARVVAAARRPELGPPTAAFVRREQRPGGSPA